MALYNTTIVCKMQIFFKRKNDKKFEKVWNYKYKNSGTYGQTEYTVRERSDGTKDMYIVSDSGKSHSHTLIDKDGNVIETYHEYLDYYSELMNESNVRRKVFWKY